MIFIKKCIDFQTACKHFPNIPVCHFQGNGIEIWYFNGIIHRTNGPAIVWPHGSCDYTNGIPSMPNFVKPVRKFRKNDKVMLINWNHSHVIHHAGGDYEAALKKYHYGLGSGSCGVFINHNKVYGRNQGLLIQFSNYPKAVICNYHDLVLI